MAITDEMIARINVLAKKAKNEGLSFEETQEQKELRAAYVSAFRSNLQSQLNTIVVEDDQGKRTKLSNSLDVKKQSIPGKRKNEHLN